MTVRIQQYREGQAIGVFLLTMPAKRVALITGCSDPSSLGAAFALDLLKRGWKVYATAIEIDSMSSLKTAGCDVRLLMIVMSSELIIIALGARYH